MPIYEYACTACGHQMEALQKISAEPLLSCPECKEDTLAKQISKVAFRLKGTGWYETDFKDKKKGDGKDSGKSDAGTAAKSDKKGDAGGSKSDGGAKSSSDATPSKTTSSDKKAS